MVLPLDRLTGTLKEYRFERNQVTPELENTPVCLRRGAEDPLPLVPTAPQLEDSAAAGYREDIGKGPQLLFDVCWRICDLDGEASRILQTTLPASPALIEAYLSPCKDHHPVADLFHLPDNMAGEKDGAAPSQ